MTVDARIPTMPGRSTSGFHRPDRHCLHQAPSAVRCWTSRMTGELHHTKNRLIRTFLHMDDSIELVDLFSGQEISRFFIYTDAKWPGRSVDSLDALVFGRSTFSRALTWRGDPHSQYASNSHSLLWCASARSYLTSSTRMWFATLTRPTTYCVKQWWSKGKRVLVSHLISGPLRVIVFA